MKMFVSCDDWADEKGALDCERGAVAAFLVDYVRDDDGTVDQYGTVRCPGHAPHFREDAEGMGDSVVAEWTLDPCCLGGPTTGRHSAFCPWVEAERNLPPKCVAVLRGGRMSDCSGCAGCA